MENTNNIDSDQLTWTQVVEFCTTLEQALKSALDPQIGERIVKKTKEIFEALDITVLKERIDTLISSQDPLKTFSEFNSITQQSLIQTLEENKDYFENLLQRYVKTNGVDYQYVGQPAGYFFILDDQGKITLDKLITTLKSVLPNQTQSSPEQSLTNSQPHWIITPERLRKKMPNVPTYIKNKNGTYIQKFENGTTKEVEAKEKAKELGQQEIYTITMTVNNDTRERVFVRNKETIKKLYKIFWVNYKSFEQWQTEEATTYIKDTIFQKYQHDPNFKQAFDIPDWFNRRITDSDKMTLRTLIKQYQQDCNMGWVFPGYRSAGGGGDCWAGYGLYLWLPLSVGGNPVCLWSSFDRSGLIHGSVSNAHPALL